jgi:hypothetical protein
MGTIAEPLADTTSKKRNLVEMSWDPITRIVGSLGIFTKIDFESKQVAECHSTSLPVASAASAATTTLPAPAMRRTWHSE